MLVHSPFLGKITYNECQITPSSLEVVRKGSALLSLIRTLKYTHPSVHKVKDDRHLASVLMEMLDIEQDKKLCEHVQEVRRPNMVSFILNSFKILVL